VSNSLLTHSLSDGRGETWAHDISVNRCDVRGAALHKSLPSALESTRTDSPERSQLPFEADLCSPRFQVETSSGLIARIIHILDSVIFRPSLFSNPSSEAEKIRSLDSQFPIKVTLLVTKRNLLSMFSSLYFCNGLLLMISRDCFQAFEGLALRGKFPF
jgi:hypothetical protein